MSKNNSNGLPPDGRGPGYPGDLKGQLGWLARGRNEFMSPTNKTRDKRSPVIGKYTQYARLSILGLFIDTLHLLGFYPQYLDNISARHVRAAVDYWDSQGCVTRTLQTRLSAIRMMFAWGGRSGALPPNKELLKPHHWRSSSVAKKDKTWIGNGLDVYEVINWVPESDTWIRFSLEFQREFGLRVKESALLKIHEADLGDYLRVNWGTKGGRSRLVPITNAKQRDLIKRCKLWCPPGQSLIGPQHKTSWRQARRRYDYVLGKILGINRKSLGIASHGLRCEFLCEQYFLFTGELAPVRGGAPIDSALDRAARQYIATLAGHNRPGVVSAYCGAVLRKKK